MVRIKTQWRPSCGPGTPKPLNPKAPGYPKSAQTAYERNEAHLARAVSDLANINDIDSKEHQAASIRLKEARYWRDYSKREADKANGRPSDSKMLGIRGVEPAARTGNSQRASGHVLTAMSCDKGGGCEDAASIVAHVLGSLRFRPPQPFDAPWEQVLDCGAFGPYCTQDSYITGVPDDGSSEDCLTLNVWTPSGARMSQSNVPLPVLAFIFGGGFDYGGPPICIQGRGRGATSRLALPWLGDPSRSPWVGCKIQCHPLISRLKSSRRCTMAWIYSKRLLLSFRRSLPPKPRQSVLHAGGGLLCFAVGVQSGRAPLRLNGIRKARRSGCQSTVETRCAS
jgi:hypothetical protein